ncbi:MAG: POTRA domain-containing protein, partial [Maribacter sp.]
MFKIYLSLIFLFVFLFGFSQTPRIVDVKFKGTKRIKVSFIKKLINTKAGSALDSLQINEDVIRLKRLPSVSHAYFQI